MWLVYCLGVVLPSQKVSSSLNFSIGKKSFMVACWCNSWRSWSNVKINMLAKWGSWWAVAFKIFVGETKNIQIGIVVVFQTLFSFLKENMRSKAPFYPSTQPLDLWKLCPFRGSNHSGSATDGAEYPFELIGLPDVSVGDTFVELELRTVARIYLEQHQYGVELATTDLV